ncbi:MAG: HD-GYP domain-containing protein [Candidatus Eremiobacteraeota bacterium]|nr:HD-GYP domain-containing protein [Candidatus Eremiobacteraeota bacterium]
MRPSEAAANLRGESAGNLPLSSGNNAQLTSLRQLRVVWSSLLDSPQPQTSRELPQKPASEPERNLNKGGDSRARASGSDNANFSRLDVRLFSGRIPSGPSPGSERRTEAQARTQSPEGRSTTQNQTEQKVQLRSSPESRLANGRVVTGQSPVHSPILDQANGELKLQPQKLTPEKLTLPTGSKLAEFAMAHAGHSIESLLKKAYKLESRSQLGRDQAVLFMSLVLKLGGEFTAAHSARVLELAMDLADEVGLDEQTRQDVEQGVAFKDLGEMALMLDGAPPEKLEKMGEWLSGQDLHQAGLLHDIGKTRIPNEILYKPGKLSEEEYELMKLHPVLGEQMIQPIESLRHLCPVIRGHHERWDGKGYPDGLVGEQIPLGARIIAVADVFDALHAERPYKASLPVEKVRAILMEGRGTHFDPQLADAFGRVLERRYPELGNPFG